MTLSARKKAQRQKIEELADAMGVEILAHFYQREEVKDLAHFVGGSRSILERAKVSKANALVICGVSFVSDIAMGIRPDIPVLVPRADASCPYSESLAPETITKVRKLYPEAIIAAGLKTHKSLLKYCDIILPPNPTPSYWEKFNGRRVFVLPSLDEAPFGLPGVQVFGKAPLCQIHAQIEAKEVLEAKERFPAATVIANILCTPMVKALADYALDSDGIADFVRESTGEEFLVIAESGLVISLAILNPGKKFYELETEMFCPNMKLTNIKDILYALEELMRQQGGLSETGKFSHKERNNALFG
ncbi:MAG: quinolinate synthase NadA [Deltaproteobacteria bacterium]|jgi:quinolinate synthase|nr:quinolinate synthase NadA [Deltaproteobacteria bacterium]